MAKATKPGMQSANSRFEATLKAGSLVKTNRYEKPIFKIPDASQQ